MPIHPLPQFEADVAEFEREKKIDALVEKGFSRDELEGLDDGDLQVLDRKAAPKTLVVRFGVMKLIGEYPCRLDATPGCGSKVVAKTHRGTEIAETLTSTCPNAGCSKSVSRNEMLDYIDRSGGRNYPFNTKGRVLRIATPDDMNEHARLEQSRHALKTEARSIVASLRMPIKIVDVEPILGGERLTYYYASEERIDHTVLIRELGRLHRERIDLRHVGARDEARITADYEKCGQYCCCKNFLKVLKPVSMKSAKIQKATLDPVKISGRCGRLMCCLRYEDETYDELRKKLPKKKTRVGSPEGDGIVVDTQILTQLALIELDDGKRVAIPIENLTEPVSATAIPRPIPSRPSRPGKPGLDRKRSGGEPTRGRTASPKRHAPDAATATDPTTIGPETDSETGVKKKRRRRRKRKDGTTPGTTGPTGDIASADNPNLSATGTDANAGGKQAGTDHPDASEGAGGADGAQGEAKKRRRRRRRKRSGGADNAGDSGGNESGNDSGNDSGGLGGDSGPRTPPSEG